MKKNNSRFVPLCLLAFWSLALLSASCSDNNENCNGGNPDNPPVSLSEPPANRSLASPYYSIAHFTPMPSPMP